jgi:hypothetical protein
MPLTYLLPRLMARKVPIQYLLPFATKEAQLLTFISEGIGPATQQLMTNSTAFLSRCAERAHPDTTTNGAEPAAPERGTSRPAALPSA